MTEQDRRRHLLRSTASFARSRRNLCSRLRRASSIVIDLTETEAPAEEYASVS